MPQERFFQSKDVRLHYLDWGGTGQTVVLLAGLGDTAQLYRSLAPRLAGNFSVLGLTRRGHGRSERPDAGYDLDTLVKDIRRFIDTLGIERAILIGHSFAGLEMPRFAVRHPDQVIALVYLDALFPPLDLEPDFSDDPTGSAIPTGGPTKDDLASRAAYLAYWKRARPAWANIWCDAIEADLMDKATLKADGRVVFHHDDALMNRIYRETWPARRPEYAQVTAPMLAIVPDGDRHQGCPPDASPAIRQAADRYWALNIRPWIRQRTASFCEAAPTARVVNLDSPFHHIYLAEEDATLRAIDAFLANLQ